MASSPSFRLEYFNIEGAGEKVRLAFALAGVPFEDVRIAREDWPARKQTARYGQLPILTMPDGSEVYQSQAMLRYVGSLGSGSLYPSDPGLRLKVDEVLGLADDLQREWDPCFRLSMSPDKYGYPADMAPEAKGAIIKQLREAFVATALPKFMAHFAEWLEKSGGAFLCGPEPTIADCQVLPQLRYFTRGIADHVPTDCLDPYPAITAYIQRMMDLPPIKAWYEARASA